MDELRQRFTEHLEGNSAGSSIFGCELQLINQQESVSVGIAADFPIVLKINQLQFILKKCCLFVNNVVCFVTKIIARLIT